MKRHTLFIYIAALLTMFGTVLPVNAQKKQKQDALYIYRNDGGFMGFFYDDIERFEYSCIDTLGIVHDDFVVQEIYALDTLFRIPLSAIDSIAFVTPETVYKADVAHTVTSDMWNYVIRQDSLTLILATNTPSGMIPKVGEKLAYGEQSEKLPAGFAGLVKNVSNGTEGIFVDCEQVSLLDVFDQFVSKGRAELSPSNAARTRAGGEKPYHIDLPDYSVSVSLASEFGVIPDVAFTASGTAAITISNSFDICAFMQAGLYTGLQYYHIIRGVHRGSIDFSVGGGISVSHDFYLGPPIIEPVIGPLLYFQEDLGMTFGGSGNIYLTGGAAYGFSSYNLIQFNSQFDGQQQAVLTFRETKKEGDKASGFKWNFPKLAGKVSLNSGLFFESNAVSITKDVVKTGFRAEAGLRADLGFDFKWSDLSLPSSETLLYDIFNRDGSVSIYPYCNGQFHAKVGGWKHAFIIERALAAPWEGGLVPAFHNTAFPIDNVTHKAFATADLSRQTLFPSQVGFTLEDKKTENQNTVWYYKNYDNNFKSFDAEFKELYGGQKLRVYPTTKLFGFKLLGKPYKDVDIEPVIKALPSPMSFQAEGGDESLVVNANMPIDNIKVEQKTGAGGKNWLSYTLSDDINKTSKVYTFTATENTEYGEREATIIIEALRGDGEKETMEIPITQDACIDGDLTISSKKIDIAGYDRRFKQGLYTTPLIAIYSKDAQGLTLTSSDDSWLTVEADGPATTFGDNAIEIKYKVIVKPNISFKTTRYGVITAELTLADGKKGRKRIEVTQSPIVPDFKMMPECVILKAEEAVNAEYSDLGESIIESVLLNEGFKPYISKQEVIPHEEWIEPTLKGKTVEIRAKAYPNEDEPRPGNVAYRMTLTSGESTESPINVFQREKGAEDLFTLTPRKPRFPAEGGNITCSVGGENVERVYSVDMHSSDWLGGSGMNNNVTLLAKATSELEERCWQFGVEVLMKDGTKVMQEYIAYQDPLGELTVSATELTIPKIGGVQEVDVNIQGDYEKLRISSSANWCKAVLMDYHKAEIAADENPLSQARKATVTIEFVADDGTVLRTATILVEQTANDEGGSQPTGQEDQLLYNSWKHSDETNSGYYMQVKFGTDGTYLEVYTTPQQVITLGDGTFKVLECVHNTKPEYYSEGREWMFAVLKNYDYYIRYKISRNYKNEKGKSFSDQKYAWVTPDGRYLVFCDEIYNAEEGAQATAFSISKRYVSFPAEGGSETIEVKNYGKGKLGVRVNESYKGWLTATVVEGGIRITALKNDTFYSSYDHSHNGFVIISCTDDNGQEYITEQVIVNQTDNRCKHEMIYGASVSVQILPHYITHWTGDPLWVWDPDNWHDVINRRINWRPTEFRGNAMVTQNGNGVHIELSSNKGEEDHYTISFDIDNFSDDINVGLKNSKRISNLKIDGVFTSYLWPFHHEICDARTVYRYSIEASNIPHRYADEGNSYYGDYLGFNDTGLTISYFSLEGQDKGYDYFKETINYFMNQEDPYSVRIEIFTLPSP